MQLARSEAFISSEKARELTFDLERLKSAIVETIGAGNPKLAAELLWLLLDLHASILKRLDDSGGRIGALFRSACQDLGPILKRAKIRPGELAPLVLRRITDNGYGIYDGIVFALNDALGREGRNELRKLLDERREAHLVSEKRTAVRPGHFDYTLSGLLLALRDIADCENDVDAFIDTYEGFDLTNPAYRRIAQVCSRGRAKRRFSISQGGQTSNRHFKELEWTDVRIGVLEARTQGLRAGAAVLPVREAHERNSSQGLSQAVGDFEDVRRDAA